MTKKTETKQEQPENTPNEEVIKETLESATSELALLKQDLANQVVELEELHSASLEESQAKDAEIAKLNEQLEALKNELAEVKSQKESFEQELKAIEEAKLLTQRLSILNELGFLRRGEEGQREQAGKVRAMSQEDFDSYVSELKAIFSQVSEKATKKAEEKQEESAVVEAAVEEICKEDNETAAADEEVTDLISRVLSSFNAKPSLSEELANEGEEKEIDSPAKEEASVDVDRLARDLAAGFTEIYNYKN